MIKKPTLIILAVLAFLNCNAQKQELGKVTIDELKQKVCPTDTSAAAAVLFNIGKSYFDYSANEGFRLITEIITKVKIYKKEGYEFASHSQRYYIGGNESELVNYSKATTYNLVDGKIEKTKLSGDGEFNEKMNKYWGQKKITMPNVKEGSIIEYRMEIRSPYFHDFPEWEFQDEIPVVYSRYTTLIPEYYIFNPRFKGYLTPKIEKEDSSKSLSITTKDRSEGLLAKTNFDSQTLTYIEAKTVYTLENVPALKDESYVNNIDNYTAAVLHELASVRFPNSSVKSYSTDWETVVKKIYESDDFGTELNKTGYFEKDLDQLLSSVPAQSDRIAAIYDFVKSKMNWNEFRSIYCDGGVRKAYQDKKGNVAEINLMLTAMLRYAGIPANPVILSTRQNGIALYPSNSAYDYVIAGVEIDGGHIVLLDATEKYALPNLLPIRDLNWFGRVIRKDGTSSIINLMPDSNSKDVINIMANINNNGEVTGKVRDQYFDYHAYTFRNANNGMAKDAYIDMLEKKYQGLEVRDYEVQNSNDLSKPLIENYSFTTTSFVEIIGDKMYVSPFLFFAKTENPFKQENREYPVDFVFPKQTKYNISIVIPEGYAVELLPAPKLVSMPDELASFRYNITTTGNQIQVLYTLDVNNAIINADYYGELKAFFKEIIDNQTEKIVLKKV